MFQINMFTWLLLPSLVFADGSGIAAGLQGAVMGGSLMIAGLILAFAFRIIRKLFFISKNKVSSVVTKDITPYIKKIKEELNEDENGLIDEDEEAIYTTISEELSSGERKEGLWLRAIEKAEGDEKKALAFYIKYRSKAIKIDLKNQIILEEEVRVEQAKEIEDEKQKKLKIELENQQLKIQQESSYKIPEERNENIYDNDAVEARIKEIDEALQEANYDKRKLDKRKLEKEASLQAKKRLVFFISEAFSNNLVWISLFALVLSIIFFVNRQL